MTTKLRKKLIKLHDKRNKIFEEQIKPIESEIDSVIRDIIQIDGKL